MLKFNLIKSWDKRYVIMGYHICRSQYLTNVIAELKTTTQSKQLHSLVHEHTKWYRQEHTKAALGTDHDHKVVHKISFLRTYIVELVENLFKSRSQVGIFFPCGCHYLELLVKPDRQAVSQDNKEKQLHAWTYITKEL